MTLRRLIPLATALTLAATLVALPACNKTNAQPAAARGPATIPVTLTPVQKLPVTRTVEVVGTLHGEEETVVSAKVPGRIIALYKDVGDPVAPGEPLVQLKQNDYQLAVTKAELAMKEVLAKLGLTELPPPDFDVSKIPTVVRAKLQADNAQARFNRNKQLFESTPPTISPQDFQDIETALRVARAAHDVELLNARALVASAWALKGDLDIATQRLTDATTRAPSTPEPATRPTQDSALRTQGSPRPHEFIVTARYVNVGELVREITPAYKLVDDNPIKLRAQVPERFVSQVKLNQKAKVRVEAYPTATFEGQISRINPQIELANRMFTVEILIPNDDRRLKPGAFARAAIETTIQPDVHFVPAQSLITFAGVNKVFTVKDNKAVEINVDPGPARLGDENNPRVEIAKGLKGQEQIVVTNANKLANGTPVTTQPPPSTRPAAAPADAPVSN
jgi:RND family efflux transporter MFP subunit